MCGIRFYKSIQFLSLFFWGGCICRIKFCGSMQWLTELITWFWYGDIISTAVHYKILFVGNYMHGKGVKVSGYAYYMQRRQNSNRNKVIIMINTTTTSSSINHYNHYDKINYLVWLDLHAMQNIRSNCLLSSVLLIFTIQKILILQ